MTKAFVSWSGGKDCCLSTFKAMRDGHDIKYLASIITEENGRLWPHMLKPEIMDIQAKAVGIPLLKWTASVSTYNEDYQAMLAYLKEQGIEHGFFGDVSVGNAYAPQHESWVASVCAPIGITAHMPLWGQNRETILRDVIDSCFEVIIIATAGGLGTEYLGRTLDHHLLKELKERHESSSTGNAGYYHTFVIDGPIFKKRLNLTKTEHMFVPRQVKYHYDIWYLDIQECILQDKEDKAIYTFPDKQIN
ncbi:MAG: diphthine--ammonia ligase [Chloroflexi bacterium]|nr:diphthine--ammonia ligase [Chloroflexota bacterium]